MNNQEVICRKIGVIVGFVLNICVTLVLTLVKVVSKESKTIAKDFEAIDNGEAVKATPVVEEAEFKETAEEIKELVGGEVANNEVEVSEVDRIKEEMARLQKSLELAEQKVGK
jgi:hypothetical protein|nr:MAG TPA: hypothetical protein [Caudoviricetes sp.]